MPPLKNARQELFVQELVRGKSARDAYALAGYKPHHGDAQRLQRRSDVKQRYHELAGAAAHRAEVTAVNVINEIATIAFANIADFITLDAQGKPQPNLTKMTREQSAALVEVSASGQRVRVKMADKLKALEHLGRMLGLFRERVELSGTNDAPIETREVSDLEAARRIAFVLAKAAVCEQEPLIRPPSPLQAR